MSKKAMPVYELATGIMACYGRRCAVQDAITLIEQDRAIAHADGEAAGYARAVEEIAEACADAAREDDWSITTDDIMAELLEALAKRRAKLGDK